MRGAAATADQEQPRDMGGLAAATKPLPVSGPLSAYAALWTSAGPYTAERCAALPVAAGVQVPDKALT